MKRLFTFGCSFTNYKWATWADILGLEYDHYEYWGFGGSSNQFIFYSLTEFLQRNTLTESDTVVVMWTSINRSCKFVNNKWVHELYNSPVADEVNEHLITTANIISSVNRMLKSTKCNFHFLSMIKPTDEKHPYVNANDESTHAILNTYKSAFDSIHPSMYDIIYKSDWYSLLTDNSPPRKTTPVFLNNMYTTLEKDYKNVGGPDWPPLTKALEKDFSGVSDFIQDEILINFRWAIDILMGEVIPQDTHPLPMDHFEYLAKLGIWDLTKKQLNHAEIWQEDLSTESHLGLRDKEVRLG